MLGIICFLSCLGAALSGGVAVSDPLLSYSLADNTRTSIAYGNSAFLSRYGLATPFAGGAAVHGGLVASEPFVGARFAAPALAHVAAPAIASVTAAPAIAAVTAAPILAHAPAVAAVGNSAFLSRYGLATPFAGGVAVHGGLVGARFAAPALAHVAAPAIASVTAAPAIAAVTAAPILAHAPAVAAVRTSPFIASSPLLSSVEHVPAVAQVPVTKYEAQPAVIQNVLNVANPKIATRKFEIRRPAIQKEFYDIEERVVVRPAGSAVVELEQPISKSQRGPTVVSPAGPSVAPVAGVRALHLAPSLHAPFASHLHSPVFPAFPAVSITPSPIYHQPISSPVAVTPIPQQPIIQSTPRPDFAQFDDDSVSIENPELGRARIAQQEYTRQDAELRSRIAQQQQQQEAEQRARSESEYRAQQEYTRQDAELRSRIAQQQQRQEAEQRARSEAEYRAQQEYQARARMQAQQQIIEQQQFEARFAAQQHQLPVQQRQSIAPAPVSEAPEVRTRLSNINTAGLVRTSAHQEEIPSVRNLPEVELSNQARLIALLTERGPVSEIRSADGLSASVRARVLSATPAPFDVAPRDEKVSTRRVVVNRPIQTVQEVDVVEPFTKIERIAVNQPTLINTARLGVANVPTSLPVQTYTQAHYAL